MKVSLGPTEHCVFPAAGIFTGICWEKQEQTLSPSL